MGKKRRQGKPRAAVAEEAPGSGLGGLAAALAAQGLSGSGVEASAPATAPPSSGGQTLRGKAVVRRERKGRGGKTVTLIDGAAITRTEDLDGLARALRKALGTGARTEGSAIVVQGDHRQAAARWLEARGATVVLGN